MLVDVDYIECRQDHSIVDAPIYSSALSESKESITFFKKFQERIKVSITFKKKLKLLTNSNVLQLRSQPDDEQQRLSNRMAILQRSGAELPCLCHHETEKLNY